MRSRGHPPGPVAGPVGVAREGAGSALPRAARLRNPLLAAGATGALAVALRVRDPHTSGSWGLCPWLLLTGSFCPGCGSLRAVNDLTHGDLLGAASSNLLLVAMLPLLVFWWLRWTRREWARQEWARQEWAGQEWAGHVRTGRRLRRRWTGQAAAHRDLTHRWIALAALVTVVFGVLRNLPAGAWLAP